MAVQFDTVLQGGLVVLPDREAALDIGIKDGKITALAVQIPAAAANTAVDVSGCIIMPGMIDMHVHFNEPGFGHWEGFASGSAASAVGGVTTYVDMPLNGQPPTVNSDALQLKKQAAAGRSAVDYALWGGLVPGNLSDLAPMASNGVIGYKAFMSDPGGEGEERFREIDDWTLFQGMQEIAKRGGVVALHAESDAITARLGRECREQGRTGAADFVKSRPVIAELEAISKAVLFAGETGCRLHIVHVSSPEGVELLHRAKADGVDVTIETCPHYLMLTDEDMERLGPVAKCAPPLRSAASRERMWALFADGTIDIVASDHSPCPEGMKLDAPTFLDAWGGIAGVQSSLELMLDEGWKRRGIPLHRIANAVALAPAKRLGLYPRKGAIEIGLDADFAVIDPSQCYTLSRGDLLQQHAHSPYLGQSFSLRVKSTMLRGEWVYELGKGLLKPNGGRLLVPLKEGLS